MLSVVAKSQTKYFYYFKGGKIPLEVDTRSINIIMNNSPREVGLYQKAYNAVHIYNEEKIEDAYLKVDYGKEQNREVFEEKVYELRKNPDIKGIGIFFKQKNGKSVPISNYFYVKLKTKDDYRKLESFSNKKRLKLYQM